jgi:hypothetical protein
MQLELPRDWRDRLLDLANFRTEQEEIEGKLNYLRQKLRRLRELYLEGDFDKLDYDQRKADLQTQLAALEPPEEPSIEQAAEVLKTISYAWQGADAAARRELLQVVFKAVHVDLLGRQLVSVQPHKDFVPLFRLDGLEEREGGVFYYCQNRETEPAS